MSFWGVQVYDIYILNQWLLTIETTTRYRSKGLKLCQPQKLLALPPSLFHFSFSFGTSDNSNSNLPNLHSIITTWCQGTRTNSAARFGEPSSWKYECGNHEDERTTPFPIGFLTTTRRSAMVCYVNHDSPCLPGGNFTGFLPSVARSAEQDTPRLLQIRLLKPTRSNIPVDAWPNLNIYNELGQSPDKLRWIAAQNIDLWDRRLRLCLGLRTTLSSAWGFKWNVFHPFSCPQPSNQQKHLFRPKKTFISTSDSLETLPPIRPGLHLDLPDRSLSSPLHSVAVRSIPSSTIEVVSQDIKKGARWHVNTFLHHSRWTVGFQGVAKVLAVWANLHK